MLVPLLWLLLEHHGQPCLLLHSWVIFKAQYKTSIIQWLFITSYISMVPVTMGAYNTIAGIYLFFLLQCVQCLFSRTHLSAYFIKRRESATTRVVAYPNLEVVQAAQDSKVTNTNSVINVNPEYQNFY